MPEEEFQQRKALIVQKVVRALGREKNCAAEVQLPQDFKKNLGNRCGLCFHHTSEFWKMYSNQPGDILRRRSAVSPILIVVVRLLLTVMVGPISTDVVLQLLLPLTRPVSKESGPRRPELLFFRPAFINNDL